MNMNGKRIELQKVYSNVIEDMYEEGKYKNEESVYKNI